MTEVVRETRDRGAPRRRVRPYAPKKERKKERVRESESQRVRESEGVIGLC